VYNKENVVINKVIKVNGKPGAASKRWEERVEQTMPAQREWGAIRVDR
jgi:hypothetical protein